jgi:glycerophosphoryl diester phosphodiesterase
LVVAHRGASARVPENTLAAFEAAVADGADVVELDVRLTADGIPVVLHDPDVSATTEGTGFVHELSLRDVKGLDASRGDGERQEIPMLAEALEAIRGVGVNLEIKNLPGEPGFDSPREATLEATLDVLGDLRFGGPVLVSSFNWLTIERARELAPGVRTGFLTIAAVDPWASLVYVRAHGHDFVLPQAPALAAAGPDFVRDARRDGVRVGTWVVDDEDDLTTLFSWGVDAVATNDPRLAVEVRDRAQ